MEEERLNKLDYFMGFARQAARRGTCSRLRVGAVIVNEGIILATAYNGAPMNLEHCDHTFNQHESCKMAVHAEMNAIIFAGRDKAKGSTMFITHSPCLACSGPLIQSGIATVIYDQIYRNEDGINNLLAAKVQVLSSYEAQMGKD